MFLNIYKFCKWTDHPVYGAVWGQPALVYSHPASGCPSYMTTTQAVVWTLVYDLECKRVSLLLLPVICHVSEPWGSFVVLLVAECLPASSAAHPTICINWIQEWWMIIRMGSWMTFRNPREVGRGDGHPVSPWITPGVSIPTLLSLVSCT